MKLKDALKLIAAPAISMACTAVMAHVVLQDGAAAAGASYRATFRVGHGGDGASTTGLRVTIPAGFNGAQPMPKPGWTLYTRVSTLPAPYTSHGKTVTEGIVEIRWEANGPENALPHAFYDEFVLRGTTPTQPGPLWFKVVQTCEKGENAWVEVPASGTSTKGLKAPAALLEVLDIQATGHAH
ncbi:MAG: nuclear export factor GLE1 [Burkholderiales bacterium PBB4]|nr:MAG: nuclear export factor GLE1 [Burkholderiales bacterium PBB4]